MMNPLLILTFWMGIQEEVRYPQPTKEQIALVKQMDDDSYEVRELANQKLLKQMPKSMHAVRKYGLNHTSLEVRVRAKRIVSSYYGQQYNIAWPGKYKDLPSFWALSEKEYKVGSIKFDLSQDDVCEVLKKYVPEDQQTDYNLNVSAEKSATHELIMRLIQDGYDPKDINGLLKAMDESNKRYDGCRNPWGYSGP